MEEEKQEKIGENSGGQNGLIVMRFVNLGEFDEEVVELLRVKIGFQDFIGLLFEILE